MKQKYIIEYDLKGNIIEASDDVLTLFNTTRKIFIGKHHKDIVELSVLSADSYKIFWSDLREGKTRDEINKFKLDDKYIRIFETYIPKRNHNGYVSKIICYVDIFVQKEYDAKGINQKAKQDSIVKKDMKKNMTNLISEQNDMQDYLNKIREKNAKRMEELKDSDYLYF